MCTAAHDRHDFSEAGRAAYDFFWLDFADWYIEASKARLQGDPEDRAAAQRVLVYVAERAMRIWHPFMPYISEQLWQALPHEGESLVVAAWPEGRGARCAAAARLWGGALRAVVGAVRNARAEYTVELSKKVEAVVVAEDEETRAALRDEAAALCLLAKIEPSTFRVRSALLSVRSALPWMMLCLGRTGCTTVRPF